jgi:hypothetical protein
MARGLARTYRRAGPAAQHRVQPPAAALAHGIGQPCESGCTDRIRGEDDRPHWAASGQGALRSPRRRQPRSLYASPPSRPHPRTPCTASEDARGWTALAPASRRPRTARSPGAAPSGCASRNPGTALAERPLPSGRTGSRSPRTPLALSDPSAARSGRTSRSGALADRDDLRMKESPHRTACTDYVRSCDQYYRSDSAESRKHGPENGADLQADQRMCVMSR